MYPNKQQEENTRYFLLRNEIMKNLSVNVIDCILLLKVWSRETLKYLKINNTMMYVLNMKKLLMLLKLKTVMMKYMMLTMYTIIKKFLRLNVVNF